MGQMNGCWTGIRLVAAMAAALISAAVSASSATAQSLEERPGYVAAISALQNGNPDTAAVKLAELLETADLLTPIEKDRLLRLRIESLVRSGATGSALGVAADPSFGESAEKAFWHGLALIQAGSDAEALARLESIENLKDESFPHGEELTLNLATIRHRLGSSEIALETLGPLLRSETTRGDIHEKAILLAARIQMDRGRLDDASELLDSPIRVEGVDITAGKDREFLRGWLALRKERPTATRTIFENLAPEASTSLAGQRAIFGQAMVAAEEGSPKKAAGILLDFIEMVPESPILSSAFERLAAIGGLNLAPTTVQFRRWSSDTTLPSRQSLALLYSALAASEVGDDLTALDFLNRFLSAFLRHPLREAAQIQQIEMMIGAGLLDEASDALASLETSAAIPITREQIPLLRARVQTAMGHPEEAVPLFQATVTSAVIRSSRETGAFNGAMAAVLAGDEEAYDRFAENLSGTGNDRLAGDLMLERGLYESAQAEPNAFEHLDTFVRRFPEHPQVADAKIALAELYLNQVPSQPVSARESLDSVEEKPLTLDQREWLDYVAIWIEVAAQSPTRIIDRASQFLTDWPKSARRPSVSMVLGETYYHLADYPNAVTRFEALATETPEADNAEAALFFAAKAASQTLQPKDQQRAIELWDRVAIAGGPLAGAARHEQGLLKLSLEAFDEAAASFDMVSAMEGVDPEIKIAALADKGETYYAKAAIAPSEERTALLEAAAGIFAEVVEQEAATKSWRLQASVRRGKCLEALGQQDKAMELYVNLVRDGAPAGPVAASPTAEFDWFFRAGLAAIRLLQREGNWEAAVAVADRVAQSGGPRATEAARIADRLRLRHFIWEEPGN